MAEDILWKRGWCKCYIHFGTSRQDRVTYNDHAGVKSTNYNFSSFEEKVTLFEELSSCQPWVAYALPANSTQYHSVGLGGLLSGLAQPKSSRNGS